MADKRIITIGREFGSGGREVGIAISRKLGIPFYDKELLKEASKKSGFCQEVFEKYDEKPTSSFLYALAMGANHMTQSFQRPLMLDVYLAQFDAMKKMAEEGSGVFVGRCADYVLADVPEAFHVFINADMESRIERVSKKYDLSEKDAMTLCLAKDKDRASYYNYYANNKWGDSRHYDLCVNTSKFGIEGTADLIISCLK